MNRSLCVAVITLFAPVILLGCGSAQKKDKTFFTSGSREADQRTDQRMAQTEQLRGSGEGAGDKGTSAVSKQKLSLYERLGGENGVGAIVDDFLTRAMADPRVNWDRKGVTQGGFSIHRSKSEEWKPSTMDIKLLKYHMMQFIALATGGPSKYEGKEMGAAHAGMHISNAEFDATLGDLKASLDKLQVANQEQKELLAVVESTRPQVVADR